MFAEHGAERSVARAPKSAPPTRSVTRGTCSRSPWQALYLFMLLMKANPASPTLENCNMMTLVRSGHTWLFPACRPHGPLHTPPSDVHGAPLHTALREGGPPLPPLTHRPPGGVGAPLFYPSPTTAQGGAVLAMGQVRKLRHRDLGSCRSSRG